MKLQAAAIVRTNYGTGPYIIKSVYGPCRCSDYLDYINLAEPPRSEPHYHLTCEHVGTSEVGGLKASPSYLGGYRPDGSNVWSDDRLVFEGVAEGVTGDLFAPEVA